MKQPSKTVQKACQILRRRVRYCGAHIKLPGEHPPGQLCETEVVQRATELYVEAWIVPLLDAIERGDTRGLERSNQHEVGHKIGPRSQAMEDEKTRANRP